MSSAQIDSLIKTIAAKYNLNWLLVKAVCIKESGINTWAMRYEPHFRYRHNPEVNAKKNGLSLATENVMQATSFGLMQVMGCVARECGYGDNLAKLMMPNLGLEYGCKKLSILLRDHVQLPIALAAYNAGSGNLEAGKKYANDVLEIMQGLEEKESQLKS